MVTSSPTTPFSEVCCGRRSNIITGYLSLIPLSPISVHSLPPFHCVQCYWSCCLWVLAGVASMTCYGWWWFTHTVLTEYYSIPGYAMLSLPDTVEETSLPQYGGDCLPLLPILFQLPSRVGRASLGQAIPCPKCETGNPNGNTDSAPFAQDSQGKGLLQGPNWLLHSAISVSAPSCNSHLMYLSDYCLCLLRRILTTFLRYKVAWSFNPSHFSMWKKKQSEKLIHWIPSFLCLPPVYFCKLKNPTSLASEVFSFSSRLK